MTAAADKSAPPKDGHAASSPDGGPAAAPLGNAPADGPVIVDSRMTFAAAIADQGPAGGHRAAMPR